VSDEPLHDQEHQDERRAGEPSGEVSPSAPVAGSREVTVPVGAVALAGTLTLPDRARGIVLFAHGSGSSRFSPRNRFVAGELHAARLGTLLIDLLTPEEEAIDRRTRALRFDIGLLAERVAAATGWLGEQRETRGLRIGYFGASTGAAAAGRTSPGMPCGGSSRRRC
jgi:hypothetical protein